MAQNFLAIAQNNHVKRIGLWLILKQDLLPWIASAGLSLLLFIGISYIVGGANPTMNHDDVIANLYTWAAPLYYLLIVGAVFLARQSKDVWTWVLAIVLIVFFIRQGDTNLAIVLLPNSTLQAMVAMIGFLALGRLIEYIQMRFIVKLDEPILTVSAVMTYTGLVLGAIMMDAPLFFTLFWK